MVKRVDDESTTADQEQTKVSRGFGNKPVARCGVVWGVWGGLGKKEGKEAKKESGHVHETSCQEDDGIDETDNPLVSTGAIDAKLLGEREIGAVGAGLVPALRGSANGAEGDGVPEHEGAVPLVVPLVEEGGALVLEESREGLELFGLAGDDGGAAEQFGVLAHSVRFRKGSGIADDLVWGTALWW